MVLLPPSAKEIRDMIITETKRFLETLENNVDAEKLAPKKNTISTLVDALRYKEKEDRMGRQVTA